MCVWSLLQAEHQRQLTLVFQQHTAQVAELQRSTQADEALKWRQHLAALEGQFQASRSRANKLEEDLKAARTMVPWTPAAHEVHPLSYPHSHVDGSSHKPLPSLAIRSHMRTDLWKPCSSVP